MTTATIRPLQSADHADWRRLWTDYLIFYKATVPEEVYATTWKRLFTDGEFEPKGFIAVDEGKAVGLVHYLYHRSCWTIGDYCYLQDLFVAEGARKLGLGRALIEAVYKEARATGASRVYWNTHETNATARALYDKLADRPGFIQYRKVF